MPAINPRVLADLRALQPEPGFLIELIDGFLREAEATRSRLGDALARTDVREFERAAHALKGSCGNLGAQAMSRICAGLQAAGHAADWTRAERGLSELDAEFGLVRSELTVERGR